jgi:hypothetical protein
MRQQFGTLGGGNHFIELCLDENQDVWVMLHSGSRGIGNIIGRYFIELARKDMGKHLANLPDRDLAYLREGAEHFDDYVDAVHWAQDYAMTNRREMMRLILEALARQLPPFTATKEAINCRALWRRTRAVNFWRAVDQSSRQKFRRTAPFRRHAQSVWRSQNDLCHCGAPLDYPQSNRNTGAQNDDRTAREGSSTKQLSTACGHHGHG